MADSASTELLFGIEMEMLVKPKDKLISHLNGSDWDNTLTSASRDESRKNANRFLLRQAIADMLTDEGTPATLHAEDYSAWTVADERTLDEVDGYWRIEFISNVLSSMEPWSQTIENFFDALHAFCDITLTRGCSMHIHVSPSRTGETPYTLQQLQRLMKGISFYDDAITRIMPPDRKDNQWAESSFQGPHALSNLKTAYESVPSASWKPLFSIFDKVKLKPMAYICLGENRSVSWNFANVMAACGTVEFRRPPGVKTAKEARFWAAFTLGFVRNSLDTDWAPFNSVVSYLNVKDLENFIRTGALTLGSITLESLGQIPIEENKSLPTVYSASELALIKQKKATKEDMESVFVRKVCTNLLEPSIWRRS
ncbi:putative amidoligase enzyme-domain-containing protein [Nemania sp. FL0031]|nr:putative amidoligase enzyme-domain-containing protein [Nemania sp. FL0031]